ncbi:uncharacterized protein LOC143464888 isoform X2 [Clavelina lepadiformis]|uniref:uncharacterized protein LOC143464888 isoform X2 n=1 Tax=Clavelina lepadiformis TaxID=159417 RepID=UPI0040438BBD
MVDCSFDELDLDDSDGWLLSEQSGIKRFQHLWNLLIRSNLYASALLSLIEEKQRKQKRKYKKKLKRTLAAKNEANRTRSDGTISDEAQVQSVVRALVERVIKNVDGNHAVHEQPSVNTCHASETADYSVETKVEVQATQQPNESNPETVASDDNSDSDVDEQNISFAESSFIADSGLGTSDIFMAESSVSSSNSQSGSVAESQTMSLQNDNNIAELCSEAEYLRSLRLRRGLCSSPKPPEVKEEVVIEEDMKIELLSPEQKNINTLTSQKTGPFQDPNILPSSQLDKIPSQTSSKEDGPTEHDASDTHSTTAEPTLESSAPSSPEKKTCHKPNSDSCTLLRSNETEDLSLGILKNHLEKCLYQPNRVLCPICNALVGIKTINKHLDICTGSDQRRSALRRRAGPEKDNTVRGKIRRKSLPISDVEEKEVDIHEANSSNESPSLIKNFSSNKTPLQETSQKQVVASDCFQATEAATVLQCNDTQTNLEGSVSMNDCTEIKVQKKSAVKLEDNNQLIDSNHHQVQEIKDNQEKEDQRIGDEGKSEVEVENQNVNTKDTSHGNKIPDFVESDNDEDTVVSGMPTGMESIKSALVKAVTGNEGLNEFMAQAAASAKIAAAEELEKMNSSSQSGAVKMKDRSKTVASRHVDDFETSESEPEQEETQDIASHAPVRRSIRSTRSKISYREMNSSEDDGTTEQEVKVKKRKKETSMKKKNNDSDEDYELSGDNGACLKTDNAESGSDDNEAGSGDIDVDELLSRKFYNPDVDNLPSLITKQNGVSYLNGQVLDPAQPKYLTGGVLREYQITGYQWLKILFEYGESGILADEMGLGKTIQSIAIICKLIQVKVKGPFLVCTPTSTIGNWFAEFKRFAPKVAVLLYHGTASERVHLLQCLLEQTELGQRLVVITSYEILMRDRVFLESYTWSYLILDEGHRLKSLNSKILKYIKRLSTCSKLMLTGTPLQNNLMELWSLLNFLLPEVFDDAGAFSGWFDVEAIQNNEKVLAILHQILTPFLLRRVKSDVEMKIPPKREILVMAPMASLQDKFYRATVDRSIMQLVKYKEYYKATPGVTSPDLLANCDKSRQTVATRSKQKEYLKEKYNVEIDDFVVNVTLNNMMMQLRKCCNHPYLIRYPLQPNTDQLKIDEDLVLSCGKMMLLDRMLPRLKEQNHKVLLFSQMTSLLDVLEDYCGLRHYSFVRFDGSTKCDERHQHIEKFNSDPELFLFLLSTRAGGLGINLTGADTVIIFDSDWNPQNDLQAQDRCHRIGQERPVVVYRLVTMGTIDQQIVERATRKRELERMVMHESKFKGDLEKDLDNCKSINPEELLNLLESNAVDGVAENKESVISDEVLTSLLDRSDMKWAMEANHEVNEPAVSDPMKPTSPVSDGIGKATFKVIEESNVENQVLI